ncbi:MAG: 2Fe-2S iron-sulfur cluster-binding protein [Thermodesulfobacteriota bacterium]|nr:2Fe-2S iron-sulfur cluster-binding protein [Thermodesulfobacteriota bacterium]
MIKFTVDGREITAPQGTSLLTACLDNDIYIPNLCYLKDMTQPPASCRLCFVEIEGRNQPVTSCTMVVENKMKVRTDTPLVRRLQKSSLKMLLSVHDVNCKECCATKKKCELQKIAKFLKVKLKQKKIEHIYKKVEGKPEAGFNHPVLDYNPDRCVLCGKCIYICQLYNTTGLLSFANRGFKTIISAFGESDQAKLECAGCLECVRICPVGALSQQALS